MLRIELRFPAGAYHATPWGHHVNEGAIEWPPSPWRLLRALIAVWKRTWPDLTAQSVAAILRPLAVPPLFRLPATTVAHTRHYMPWEKKHPADRVLVLDTFVAIAPNEPVVVIWPDAELTVEQIRVLDRLLANLSFLGRAESWCSARVVETGRVDPNCGPTSHGRSSDSEVVRVLAADVDSWDEWSFGSRRERPRPPWNLLAETVDIQAERWSDPPGSAWVDYARPREWTNVPVTKTEPNMRVSDITVARFRIDGAVLPLVTESISVAESFRHALLCCFQRVRTTAAREQELPFAAGHPFRSPCLSGKDAEGEPLRGHGHGYYLPSAEGAGVLADATQGGVGRRRLVDRMTVFAENGFGDEELEALDALRSFQIREGGREGASLRLMLAGLGGVSDFRSPLLDRSAVWQSVTPFVVTRHPKSRGSRKDSPNREEFALTVLREEIARLTERRPELPCVEEVTLMKEPDGGRFRRSRGKLGEDGWRRAYGWFRIRFAEAVTGPVSLGYGAHYGLGLFATEHDA